MQCNPANELYGGVMTQSDAAYPRDSPKRLHLDLSKKIPHAPPTSWIWTDEANKANALSSTLTESHGMNKYPRPAASFPIGAMEAKGFVHD